MQLVDDEKNSPLNGVNTVGGDGVMGINDYPMMGSGTRF